MYTKQQLIKATKTRLSQSNSVNGKKHFQWVLDNIDTSPKAKALANSYAKKQLMKAKGQPKPVAKTNHDALVWLSKLSFSGKRDFNKTAWSHKRKPAYVKAFMQQYSKLPATERTGKNSLYNQVMAVKNQVGA